MPFPFSSIPPPLLAEVEHRSSHLCSARYHASLPMDSISRLLWNLASKVSLTGRVGSCFNCFVSSLSGSSSVSRYTTLCQYELNPKTSKANQPSPHELTYWRWISHPLVGNVSMLDWRGGLGLERRTWIESFVTVLLAFMESVLLLRLLDFGFRNVALISSFVDRTLTDVGVSRHCDCWFGGSAEGLEEWMVWKWSGIEECFGSFVLEKMEYQVGSDAAVNLWTKQINTSFLLANIPTFTVVGHGWRRGEVMARRHFDSQCRTRRQIGKLQRRGNLLESMNSLGEDHVSLATLLL